MDKTSAHRVKRRSPLVVGFISIFWPCLGQIYNGDVKKAVCFWLIGFLFLFSAGAISALDTFIGGATVLVLSISFWIVVFIDAVRTAKRKKEITLRWYNSWFVYLSFIFLPMLLPCELANPLIRYKGAKIASGGMIPTLRIGELVIVNRGYYTDEPPLRGDLVLFTPENSERDRILRIIGLPGDTVELRDTQLFLNGEAYSEDYAQYNGGGNEQKNFGPEKIPPGHLFLLGDNRNHSEDSRLWAEPFLSIDRLKGKVVYIYWSPDNIERVGTSLILPDRKES